MIRDDGRVFYVKQTPGDAVLGQASTMADLHRATAGSQLCFAKVAGVIPDLGLISYVAAPGRP